MTLPAHAKDFRGKAKNIPAEDAYWLPYQRAWIEDKAIMKLMAKSRRIGISYATTYEHAEEHALVTAKDDTYYSSRDEATALENVRDIRRFSEALDKGARYLGEQVLDEKKQTTARVISYSSDTTFYALTSNPDAYAGKGGNVTLDELALREDPRHCCAIAFPSTDWGGKVKIISTHRGTHNYFNELVEEVKHKKNPKRFSYHEITLQTALDQGFLWKVQCGLADNDPRLEMDEAEYYDFIRARSPDDETFMQEYMCVPSDDATAFMSYDLIASCEYPGGEVWETDLADTKNEIYIGVDIGRDHDLTVIWVFEKVSGVFFTRRVIELKNTPFDAQEKELYALLALPQMRRCCIDQTGMGRQFAERAQKQFGAYRVEGITFTGPVKEELAYPLRAAFEDRSLRVPNHDHIRADFRSIKKMNTASGNIRFAADRGKNGHADRFWAAALGLHAGKTYTVALPPRRFPPTRASRARANRASREVTL